MAEATTPINGKNGSMIPLASVFTVFMILLQSISWLAWSTTNSNIERIEKRVQLVESHFLRIREHEEYARKLDAQLLKLDAQILKVEARLPFFATRDELDTRLGINSGSIIQVRTELDKLKNDLGQAYPIKEVLGNMQGRIDRMELWSRAPPPHQQQKPNN